MPINKDTSSIQRLVGGNSIEELDRHGAYQLHDRRLSIHLMVQPAVAHQLLSDPLRWTQAS